MNVGRRVLQAGMCLGLAAFLGGCGAQTATPAGPAPATAVPPASTEPFPNPTFTPILTSTPPSRPIPSADTASASPSGPPIVAASPGSEPQTLLLSDAFDQGEWMAGSYTPANETTPVDAMAVSVGCYSRQLETVEYRFAQVPGTLVVQVAQDMRSENPDLEMEFALVADGRQVTTKNVDFTGKAELSTDLAGVTVMRIGVRAAPGRDCSGSGSANALITSIVVEQ